MILNNKILVDESTNTCPFYSYDAQMDVRDCFLRIEECSLTGKIPNNCPLQTKTFIVCLNSKEN